MDHKQEVLSYFNDKIFEPGIRFSKENNIPEIARGIRYTKMRMEQLGATVVGGISIGKTKHER